MFNLDPAKLLVIAVVAIILLGPDRLPQVARQVGAAWRSLTEFRHRMESEVRSNLPDLPSSSEIARLARSPSALLDHLSSMSDDEAAGDEEHEPAHIEDAGEPVSENASASGNGPVAEGAGSNGAGSKGAGSNGSGAPVAVEGAAEEPVLRPAPVAPPPRPRGSAGNEPIVSGDPTLN